MVKTLCAVVVCAREIFKMAHEVIDQPEVVCELPRYGPRKGAALRAECCDRTEGQRERLPQ